MKPDKHPPKPPRRVYPDELKQEAVLMLLDGHSAPSTARPAPGSKRTPGCGRGCGIFGEHKRRYGARRIAAELAARGEACGPGRWRGC